MAETTGSTNEHGRRQPFVPRQEFGPRPVPALLSLAALDELIDL